MTCAIFCFWFTNSINLQINEYGREIERTATTESGKRTFFSSLKRLKISFFKNRTRRRKTTKNTKKFELLLKKRRMRRIRVGSGGTPHPGNGGGSGGPLNSSLSESEYQRVRGLVKSGGRGEDGLDNQMKLLEYIRENGTSFGDRVLGVECEEELGKILSKGASGFSRTTPITVSREVEKGEPWVNKILNDTSALDTFREAWAKEAESELERWSSHKFALPSLSSLPKLPIQANTLQKPPSLLQQQRQISQTVQTTIQQQQQQQQNQQYQQYQQQPQQQQQRSSNCRRLLNPSAKRGGKFDPASSLLKPYIRYDDEDAKDCDDEYDEEDNGNGFHMKTDFISASTKHALDEAKKGRQQQQQQQPQRSSSSLAKSNKTLGMKRKFVVPIKRDPESGPVQSNNAGNSGNGNNNSSHKAQPPKKYLSKALFIIPFVQIHPQQQLF